LTAEVVAPAVAPFNRLTFYMKDTYLGDWGCSYFLHDGIYEGIKKINLEKPKYGFAPETKIYLFEIHRSSMAEKKVEQIVNADYLIIGKIVSGSKNTYIDGHDRQFFKIIVDCGFYLDVRVYIIPWGFSPKTHPNYKPKPDHSLKADYSLNFQLGDYIKFICQLEARTYGDNSLFDTTLCGVIQSISLVSYNMGAFVTIDNIQGAEYKHERENNPSIYISEKEPIFNIKVPPTS
jgi:hypothetical protein